MGQNQSTEDPAAMTVSPGGTPHIVAPRSHPNTSSLNPSTSGPIQAPAPLLQPPSRLPPAGAMGSSPSPHPPPPAFEPPSQPPSGTSHLQSSPLSDMIQLPPHNSPLGPSSLSQQVRDLIDADPQAALSAISASSTLLPPTKIETIPSVFKWIHGGNEVFVTGSFNNWGGKFLMQRIDDNEFSLIIDLPPGSHAYKYVVDQEWKLDEDAPTVSIGGDTNNVIEVKRPVFEYPPANYADSDDDDADERKQRTAYAQGTPQVDDYVKDPIKLPPQLTTVILQQEGQQEGQLLPVPEHVVLNHLYVLPSVDRELLITGITQRFKPNSHTRITHKFVTTVFYQPRPHGESGGGREGVGGAGLSIGRGIQPYDQAYKVSPYITHTLAHLTG